MGYLFIKIFKIECFFECDKLEYWVSIAPLDTEIHFMKYLSSKQFESLNKFSFKERQQIVALAQSQLTVPEKLILNLMKLVLFIPLFWMLSTYNWLGFIVCAIIVFSAYLIIVRPLSLKFLAKYMDEAIHKFEK